MGLAAGGGLYFLWEQKIDILKRKDNILGWIYRKHATTYFHFFRVVICRQVINCISQEMENRLSESSTKLLYFSCLDRRSSVANFKIIPTRLFTI